MLIAVHELSPFENYRLIKKEPPRCERRLAVCFFVSSLSVVFFASCPDWDPTSRHRLLLNDNKKANNKKANKVKDESDQSLRWHLCYVSLARYRDKKAPPVVEALVLAFAVTSDPPNRCYPLWLIRPRSETTEIRITGWLNWCFIEPIWLQDNR